jgi:hypothetical protein
VLHRDRSASGQLSWHPWSDRAGRLLHHQPDEPIGVMVLPMDIGRDRSPDGDLARAGGYRDEPTRLEANPVLVESPDRVGRDGSPGCSKRSGLGICGHPSNLVSKTRKLALI